MHLLKNILRYGFWYFILILQYIQCYRSSKYMTYEPSGNLIGSKSHYLFILLIFQFTCMAHVSSSHYTELPFMVNSIDLSIICSLIPQRQTQLLIYNCSTVDHLMQSFGGPFHSKITWAGTGLIEGCDRRKCVLVICSLKEMHTGEVSDVM